MKNKEFEDVVQETIKELPEVFRKNMHNIAIVIEETPTKEDLKAVRGHGLLLGLYRGVPKHKRGAHYGNTLPDKIALFKDSIEKTSANLIQMKRQIKRTLLHEIGHYFGISEDKLRDLGY